MPGARGRTLGVQVTLTGPALNPEPRPLPQRCLERVEPLVHVGHLAFKFLDTDGQRLNVEFSLVEGPHPSTVVGLHVPSRSERDRVDARTRELDGERTRRTRKRPAEVHPD